MEVDVKRVIIFLLDNKEISIINNNIEIGV